MLPISPEFSIPCQSTVDSTFTYEIHASWNVLANPTLLYVVLRYDELIASGVELGSSNDEYDKYLQNFNMVKLSTGFTTKEATKYLEKIKPCWLLDQIRQIIGTNPYLLLLISSRKYYVLRWNFPIEGRIFLGMGD